MKKLHRAILTVLALSAASLVAASLVTHLNLTSQALEELGGIGSRLFRY